MDFNPHPFQERAIQDLIADPFHALFMEPGLGKTAIVLEAFTRLYEQLDVARALVIAPLRICYSTWPDEVAKWRQFNDLPTGPALWSLAQQESFIRQIVKLKYNGIYLCLWPHHPFVDFTVQGIRRRTATLLFGQKIPIDQNAVAIMLTNAKAAMQKDYVEKLSADYNTRMKRAAKRSAKKSRQKFARALTKQVRALGR